MTPPEGFEADAVAFDPDFWNDPNLIIASETLPTWFAMQGNYPGHHNPNYDSPTKMFNYVGDAVKSYFDSKHNPRINTCALRLSLAINRSGISIPELSGQTFKGADNKNYFLSAEKMLAWMKRAFGTPTGDNHLTATDGGTKGKNFTTLLRNKKGIYALVPVDPGQTAFAATGHIDIIDNSSCDGGCYFGATGGVAHIYIWILQ